LTGNTLVELAGGIIDSGNFDWSNGIPDLQEPSAGYPWLGIS
jgi:O-acetylhomoserine/O-acetylserine sulfhydrylase-like pyridoxal-dependent enzyme